MDVNSLKAQSIGLHEEIEGLGQIESNIKTEMRKLANQLKAVRFRKKITKASIERNLDQQEAFWDLEAQPIASSIESISALEDFLLDSNHSIKSIAIKHGIAPHLLTKQIEQHLHVSA